ncbi:ExeM/NucH family extracellular endonuclease [Massilia sp. erpn]|uniref:ExeM/NucH family extracellular endonuclease n=1 Tax=Massilia sp. erpn TaxID=2738142 RepID=UPI002104D70B|nr:ExeM/NucH family extracellular endonuclease [Massilia sp. erpn]UTY55772.1 ExeM/NucH family extracellular endonuclease [Massilia sp. erpn]
MNRYASARFGAPTARLTVLASLLAGLSAPALAASDIVISQVYGGGGNNGATYKADFIELFNRGAKPVALNGWSVQYASAAGTSWQKTALPDVTLQPGQYYLVREALGAGGSVDVPADLIGSIAMSGTAGKVALSNANALLSGANPGGASVIDLLGWGTANGYEGGAAAGGTGNATAVLRKDEGCSDSDNNGADFAVLAPAPRNSSAARHVCGAPVVKPVVVSCPAALPVAFGSAASAALTAKDEDGIVSSASLSGGVAGISLDNFAAASATGASASAELTVAAGVAAGSYPLSVRFANTEGDASSCDITVTVAATGGVTRRIPQIQGSGATSPDNGTVQTTEGVLTLKVGGGFFLQDAAGDGDPSTSDGLFVYTGATASNAQPGDLVRVTGTVFEYTPSGAKRSYTELKDVTAISVRSSGHSITPTNIELPNTQLDRVEGMLVRFVRPLTVSQAEYLGQRGELSLSSGRLELPTNRYAPRSAEAQALATANAANLIVLDDGIFTTPSTIPYIGQDNTVRAGDTVSDLTGVIDFGAIGGGGAAFKLQPLGAPRFSRDNPRSGAPLLAAGNVKVASANVLNFFTTFTNGMNATGQSNQGCSLGSSVSRSNCRGADNLNEFIRQRDKIVAELKGIDADVVGLMEIQNNGDTAVNYLVDSLNASYGATVYAVVPKPAATGTDAIRVAMIYKPGRLSLAGPALADEHSINNRPPMAQTFRAANGEKFSLIVNHLKSKGSCPGGSGPDADKGDGQSCWNATRVQQAQRLAQVFVPQVAASAGDPDVLLIGDMNSYGMEDPIAAITARGFVNQLERFVRPQGLPYSYVFGHQAGYLDHALASATLSPQVAGVAEWHVNADEPTVIDYNTEGKPQDLYDALPYRASDHDPVVVSLNLQPAVSDITASVQVQSSALVFNRATQKFSGTITVRNSGSAVLSGPFQLALENLTAGVSLSNATGSHDGAPYITLAASELAPGAALTVAVSFSNPSKVNTSYSTKLYRGNF